MKYLVAKCFLIFFLLSVKTFVVAEKPYYLIHDDNYCHGMFSCVTTIIGALDHYEKGECAGLEVDYQDKGLYYESSHGPNWWTYYFKPLKVGQPVNGKKEILSAGWHNHFAMVTDFELPLSRTSYLVDKYIHVKPKIEKKIYEFVNKHFTNYFVIGLHYRGTDKGAEAPRVSYEDVKKSISKAIKKFQVEKRYVLFVATDEQHLLDYLREQFSNVVYIDAKRSKNGVPVHLMGDNYKKGRDAVLDCLLLSKCHYLIRTSSNLSLVSTYFNPELPVLLLNPGVYDR